MSKAKTHQSEMATLIRKYAGKKGSLTPLQWANLHRRVEKSTGLGKEGDWQDHVDPNLGYDENLKELANAGYLTEESEYRTKKAYSQEQAQAQLAQAQHRHEARPEDERLRDEATRDNPVYNPNSEDIPEEWFQDPNRGDVQSIDTPEQDIDQGRFAHKPRKKPKQATKTTKIEAPKSKQPQKDQDYEERYQKRKARQLKRAKQYDEWAEKAEAKAEQLLKEAMAILEHHTGEPIKVDHHSAKRHRRDIERHDAKMEKVQEWKEKAEGHRTKAENLQYMANTRKGDASRDRQKIRESYGEISKGDYALFPANAVGFGALYLGGTKEKDMPEIVERNGEQYYRVRVRRDYKKSVNVELPNGENRTVDKALYEMRLEKSKAQPKKKPQPKKKAGFYKGMDLHDFQLERGRQLQKIEKIKDPAKRLKEINKLERRAHRIIKSSPGWVASKSWKWSAKARLQAKRELQELETTKQATTKQEIQDEKARQKELAALGDWQWDPRLGMPTPRTGAEIGSELSYDRSGKNFVGIYPAKLDVKISREGLAKLSLKEQKSLAQILHRATNNKMTPYARRYLNPSSVQVDANGKVQITGTYVLARDRRRVTLDKKELRKIKFEEPKPTKADRIGAAMLDQVRKQQQEERQKQERAKIKQEEARIRERAAERSKKMKEKRKKELQGLEGARILTVRVTYNAEGRISDYGSYDLTPEEIAWLDERGYDTQIHYAGKPVSRWKDMSPTFRNRVSHTAKKKKQPSQMVLKKMGIAEVYADKPKPKKKAPPKKPAKTTDEILKILKKSTFFTLTEKKRLSDAKLLQIARKDGVTTVAKAKKKLEEYPPSGIPAPTSKKAKKAPPKKKKKSTPRIPPSPKKLRAPPKRKKPPKKPTTKPKPRQKTLTPPKLKKTLAKPKRKAQPKKKPKPAKARQKRIPRPTQDKAIHDYVKRKHGRAGFTKQGEIRQDILRGLAKNPPSRLTGDRAKRALTRR
jgi:hypothetical protein